MPKKIEQWKCELCGETFDTEKDCIMHEDRENKVSKANDMLQKGCTLKEINDKVHVWRAIPAYLENATKDHCFVISHWQCCDKPAYRIVRFQYTGGIFGIAALCLWGCGSWSGYYGCDVEIDSSTLRDIHPPEELFIDKRYFNRG